MNISVLSVFPDLYTSFFKTSLIARAQEKGILNVEVQSFLSFCKPKERLDSPVFGPGAGMVLQPEIVEKAIESHQEKKGTAFRIFFSPQGKKLDQDLLKFIAEKAKKTGHLMVVPARYEGMDARVEQEYADLIVSVGDFVLMGGDLPAMMLIEGVLRYLPGVVGKQESVEHDSFSGPFVDYPHYTEPVLWHGKEVPAIVRSGHHGQIAQWRKNEAVKNTVFSHFDWLRAHTLTAEDAKLVQEYIPPHYIVLMHSNVSVDNRSGTTSVTSIDIHDIARSSKTYGIKNYFVVTPLVDQQKIVKKFLDFWEIEGPEYNSQRAGAVSIVRLCDTIEKVLEIIEAQEGAKPLIIATSAREQVGEKMLGYSDQSKIWMQKKPVLLVLGTGSGLTPEFLQNCDYVLKPVKGLMPFNHLSVRSAAAIILDRWLGLL